MKKNQMNDQKTIANLKIRNESAYKVLYQFYFPVVERLVIKNSGTKDDAKDIFQESLLVLMEKVNKADFQLTSSLKTYLFAIAQNLWLKKLREEKLVFVNEGTYAQDWEMTAESIDNEQDKKEEQIQSLFKKITIRCQEILQAIFYLNEPMQNLMQKMGWKNKHTADNQKYKCIQQMKNNAEK